MTYSFQDDQRNAIQNLFNPLPVFVGLANAVVVRAVAAKYSIYGVYPFVSSESQRTRSLGLFLRPLPADQDLSSIGLHFLAESVDLRARGHVPLGRGCFFGLRAPKGEPGICKSRQGTCHALLFDAEVPLRPCRLRPS